MRPFWTGAIGFGLVNIPVRLFPATRSHDVEFHLVHREDGSPIRYQVVCKAEDRPIDRADTARGLEVRPGQVVVFEEDELDGVAGGLAPRVIEIADFVDLADIDPVYFQKAYYAGPQPGSARPFALLRQALIESGKAAIARFGLRTKAHLACVRPAGPALAVETMFYADEVADPATIPLLAEVEASPRELELAGMLIKNLSKPWDPARYKDTTRERLEALIEQKLHGEVMKPPAPPAETKVEAIMAALEASLRGVGPEPREFEAAEPGAREKARGGRAAKSGARGGRAPGGRRRGER